VTGAAIQEVASTDKFALVRLDIVRELRAKLRLARIIYLPQLLIMSLVSIIVLAVAVWGVIQSASHLQKFDVNDTKSLIGYLSTGSSGFLGAVVFPLSRRISEMSRAFLHAEARFSQAITQASHADTKPQIINAVKLLEFSEK
jgi:hypothetical protein